jgi:hypothetical protein
VGVEVGYGSCREAVASRAGSGAMWCSTFARKQDDILNLRVIKLI